MITIKMFNGKWRVVITDEEWEVSDRKKFDSMLKSLLDIKQTFGKLEGRK